MSQLYILKDQKKNKLNSKLAGKKGYNKYQLEINEITNRKTIESMKPKFFFFLKEQKCVKLTNIQGHWLHKKREKTAITEIENESKDY